MPLIVFNMLTRLNSIIAQVCSAILLILLAIIVVTMFSAVVWRYLLFSPITWSEDLSLLCLVWMTLLGAPCAMRGGHVAADGLVTALPDGLARWISVLSNVGILFVAIIIVIYGVPFVKQGMARIVPSLDWLSQGYIYLALPVGFGLICSFCIENIFRPFFKSDDVLVGE